jgi:DNA-directed RNA polymerase specialized sigma24 family protein
MQQEEAYDSFYRSTRRGLLHQTFALTGDLPAAQAAVRDAYVDAWQQWRKVTRQDDPLDWVRPRAWQLAQRRHSTRIWHRNKGLADSHRAVLAALAKLPVAQRRLLLLVELGGLEPGHAARELGVTREVAERSVRLATRTFAEELGIPDTGVHARLQTLDEVLETASLPRGPIIRRAGRKKRHMHALVGAAATVAVALTSGAFAYQPEASSARDLHLVRPEPTAPAADTEPELPTADNLLDEDQIRRLGDARPWRIVRTNNNTSGDGVNTPCQQRRFADPDGYSAIVRWFRAAGTTRRSAIQTVEISRSAKQAQQGFDTTVGWYAGCRLGRLQVLNAYRVGNIGDEADVLMLRLWRKPVTTISVAVARSGAVTTSTVGTSVGVAPPPARQITQSLADSVSMLCARSGSEDCAKRPTYRVVPPPPSGEERGLLSVADLPPVGRIAKPWVGTDPAPARTNPSATTCDRADFRKAGAARARTRTYLIPQASVPARFGLSETYGRFRTARAAQRFVDGVRGRVATCEDRNLATDVTSSRRERHRSPALDMSSWTLSTEISEDRFVRFRVGLVRVGRTVAQVTFAPSQGDDMTGGAFRSLLVRSGDRLRELG